MPRLLSLGLAYLIWAFFDGEPRLVAPLDPIGLIGLVGVTWMWALRWRLPRRRTPWEARAWVFWSLPLLAHALFLGPFGGLHLWEDWDLPAALAATIGLLPYLVLQHLLRRGEAMQLGLSAVDSSSFAWHSTRALLLGILPLALVAQLWALGYALLPEDPEHWNALQRLASVAIDFGGLALAVPLALILMPRLFGATPFADGEWQARVDALWRGPGPSPRALRWPTQGLVANAVALGFGRWRRVLLSDRLLQVLEAQEIEGVVAHELGHLRRRHAAWLLAGAVGGILLAGSFLGHFAADRELSFAAALAALAGGLLPFLFASRAFEREADLDAVTQSPILGVGLCGALTRLSWGRRPLSLRHPPVEERIALLQSVLADPARAEPWRRRAQRVRGLCRLLFAGGLIAAFLGS